jgi:nucleotide-binding universal stress UspA family protein
MVIVDRLAHRQRHAERLARQAPVPLRTIVVPLLGHDESEHALVLACRLAAEPNAFVVLLAPLEVEAGLPLDAHFDEEEQRLREWLVRVRAYAESYGIRAETRLVRSGTSGSTWRRRRSATAPT